jgi:Flp pilus assembly protein TadB
MLGAIRASDQDRERTAAILSEHYAVGRLTLEEFQERLDRAYAARTLGELDDLMTDLPKTDPGQLPGRSGTNPSLPGRHAPGTVQPPAGRHPDIGQFWVAVTISVFVIWLISGAAGGPWFLWLAIPLGYIMLRRWLLAEERRIRNHQQDKRP